MMGKTIHSTIWTFVGIEFIITEFIILQSRGYEDVLPWKGPCRSWLPLPHHHDCGLCNELICIPMPFVFPKDLSGLWSHLPGIAHVWDQWSQEHVTLGAGLSPIGLQLHHMESKGASLANLRDHFHCYFILFGHAAVHVGLSSQTRDWPKPPALKGAVIPQRSLST